MSDESFRAELRAWLAANITDEFREKRTMTFQEKTTASGVSGEYTLSGTKMFALDAGVADMIIVAAKEEGKVGLFLAEKGAKGLTVETLEGMDVSRRLTRIKLKNTPVEKIDACNDPRQALEQALNCASFALSAEGVGGMQWILDTAVAYASSGVAVEPGASLGTRTGIGNDC